MEVIKMYCGLGIVKVEDTYLCVDMYSTKVKYSGTLAECEKYYDTYVDRLANRN